MLPINITEVIKETLQSERRVDDGLLHCSSDLCGSLRHTQLRIAGAPTLDGESDLISSLRMNTGTMWHTKIGQAFVDLGVPVMQEVKVTPWLPKGWSGIADWMFWSPSTKGFVLADLKTTKGEGLKFIKDQGVKKEHRWQVSAYWYGMAAAGFPMHDKFIIYYLPMNDTPNRLEVIEPLAAEVIPIPQGELESTMNFRYTRVKEYLSSLVFVEGTVVDFCTSELECTMEREQKVYWNAKMGVFDVKWVPHWITKFCPYPLELCDCSEQKTEKIGHFNVDEGYVYREGYESLIPKVRPSSLDFARRRKETKT